MVITAACVYLFYLFGWGAFGPLLWFKLASFAIIYMFSLGDKKKENYYYHNLGLGRVCLWVTTFTIDFLIFLLAIIITYKLI